MNISSQLVWLRRRLDPRRFLGVLLALVIAAAGPIAEAGPAPDQEHAAAAGTITAVTTTFAAVEGQTFSGVVVAFTDSDSVTPANFTNITINWGDGTPPSLAATVKATIDPKLFDITASHTFVEEGAFAVTVSFHDVLNTTNVVFSNLSASVDDGPLCVCAAVPPLSATILSGSGITNATTAIANFEAVIGGPDNGATPAPQANGFRTLTWDGVLLNGNDFSGDSIVIDPNKTVGIPVNRFQTRGVHLGRVYAVSNDGFSDVNPGVTSVITYFSPLNMFAPFNTHEVNLDFVAASIVTATTTPAASIGFGGVFINVRNPDETSIEFFDGPVSIRKDYIPAGAAASPTFFGVVFNHIVITHVRLRLGSGTIFLFDGTTFSSHASDSTFDGTNVVALDNLVFAEPQPLSTATSTITATAGAIYSGTVGTFVDTDPNASARDFTAMVDWGDGHASAGRIAAGGSGGFSVSGTHVYSLGGIYRIRLTVQDLGGAEASGAGSAASVQPFLMLPLIVH